MNKLLSSVLPKTMGALPEAASALSKLSPKNPSTSLAISRMSQAASAGMAPTGKQVANLGNRYRAGGFEIGRILQNAAKEIGSVGSCLGAETKDSVKAAVLGVKSTSAYMHFTMNKATSLPENIESAKKATGALAQAIGTDVAVAGDKTLTVLTKGAQSVANKLPTLASFNKAADGASKQLNTAVEFTSKNSKNGNIPAGMGIAAMIFGAAVVGKHVSDLKDKNVKQYEASVASRKANEGQALLKASKASKEESPTIVEDSKKGPEDKDAPKEGSLSTDASKKEQEAPKAAAWITADRIQAVSLCAIGFSLSIMGGLLLSANK
jgi:hypothetical protein